MRTPSGSTDTATETIGSEFEIPVRLSPEELAAALQSSLVEPYKQQLMGRWTRLSGSVAGGAFTVRIVKPMFGLGAHSPLSYFECVGVIEPVAAGRARLVGSLRPRSDKSWADMSKMLNAGNWWTSMVFGLFGGLVGWGVAGPWGAVAGVAALVTLSRVLLRWATSELGKAERAAILRALENVVADAEVSSPGRQEATG